MSNEKTITHPLTGEIIETPEQIIEIWAQAKNKEKQVKAELEFCKKALNSIDVPIDQPVFNNWGITSISRSNKVYDKSMLRSIGVDNDVIEIFSSIDKKPFEDWLKDEGKELSAEAKKCLVEVSSTSYFQLKEFKD